MATEVARTKTVIGERVNLTTDAKGTIVEAINEVKADAAANKTEGERVAAILDDVVDADGVVTADGLVSTVAKQGTAQVAEVAAREAADAALQAQIDGLQGSGLQDGIICPDKQINAFRAQFTGFFAQDPIAENCGGSSDDSGSDDDL